MLLGWSLVFAIGFALIHFFSKSMTFLSEKPRSRFLSFAGGVSVAYVFIHLLPELHVYQGHVSAQITGSFLAYIDNHILLVTLGGLVVFYGLERIVKKSKQSQNGQRDEASAGVFWLHISSFFVYNIVIGYLLVREEFNGTWGMFLFFVAMGVHFMINDHGLRSAHKKTYDQQGRLLLTAATLIGWGIGAAGEVNELLLSLLVAFISGGIILNVMKEELPEERESSFKAFAAGVAGYSLLLLLL